MPASPHDPYAALRHGDFRWYVLSVMAMTVATQIRGVVVAWQLYAEGVAGHLTGASCVVLRASKLR